MPYWPNISGPGWWTKRYELLREEICEIDLGVAQDLCKTMNALTDIWEADCGSNGWWLKVRLAAEPAAEAIKLIIMPSPGEILENYLEPKNGRGRGRRGARDDRRRKRGGGSRGLAWRNALPDLDELIADRIPGRAAFGGRRTGPLEYTFWTGLNLADEVLFYWMLWDVGNDFVGNWHSAIMETRFCKQAPTHVWIATFDADSWDPGEVWLNDSRLTIQSQETVEQIAPSELGTPGNDELSGTTDLYVTFRQRTRFSCTPDFRWDLFVQRTYLDGSTDTVLVGQQRVTGQDAIAELQGSVSLAGATEWRYFFDGEDFGFCSVNLFDYRAEISLIGEIQA